MTKAITTGLPVVIDRVHVQSNADAVADVPRTLAANAAWLHGYTVGGDTLDSTTPNPAPRSPMTGRPGHTHSGGVDGRPIFRTIASFCFEGHSNESGLETQTQIGRMTTTGIQASKQLKQKFGLNMPVIVPGCDPGPDVGAYAFLGVAIVFYVFTDANVSASDTCIVRIKNATTGAVGQREAAITIPITASPNWNADTPIYVQSSSDTERVAAIPGRLNLFRAQMDYTAAAGGSDRTWSVELAQVDFGVYSSMVT